MKSNLIFKVVVCTFFVIWIIAFMFLKKITATWFTNWNVLFITLVVDIGVGLGLFGFSRSRYFHDNRTFIITSNKIPSIISIGFVLCMGAGLLYREAVCKDYLKINPVKHVCNLNNSDGTSSRLKTALNKKIARNYSNNDDNSSNEYTSRSFIAGSSSSRSDSDDYDRDDGGGGLILILIIVVILLIIGSLFISHFWVLAGSIWILLLIFLLYWKQKYTQQ